MAYIGSQPTKVVSRQSSRVYRYTATAGQTAFSGADVDNQVLNVTPSDVEVHMNGLLLDATDYTVTSSSVTLGTAASAGDELTVTGMVSFEVADTYNKATADARYVAVADAIPRTGETGTIDFSDATFVPAVDQIIQVESWWSSLGTNVTTTNSWVALPCSAVTITPKVSGSKFIYDTSIQIEVDHNNGQYNAFLKLYRSVNGGAFGPVANVGSYAPIGDNVYATAPTVAFKYHDTPTYTIGQSIEYKLYYLQTTKTSSSYINQHLSANGYGPSQQGTGGTVMEVAQ